MSLEKELQRMLDDQKFEIFNYIDDRLKSKPSNDNFPPAVFKMKDAEKYLKMSNDLIKRFTNSGELKYWNDGKDYRFSKIWLDEFIHSRYFKQVKKDYTKYLIGTFDNFNRGNREGEMIQYYKLIRK